MLCTIEVDKEKNSLKYRKFGGTRNKGPMANLGSSHFPKAGAFLMKGL